MTHGTEQAAGGSGEKSAQNGLGEIVMDRRMVLLGGLTVGAAGAVFGPRGVSWLWEHTIWGEPAEQAPGARPRYIDLRFTSRPEFRQEHAEVLHFDGDPAAADKSREKRQRIAVIGLTPEQAKRQFTDKGYVPAAVYWANDSAHVAPLGSLENLGRLTIPEDTQKPDGKQIEVLAFGATIGEGDLHLSMAGLGEHGALVPARQLESAGVLTVDLMADEQHQHIPVI